MENHFAIQNISNIPFSYQRQPTPNQPLSWEKTQNQPTNTTRTKTNHSQKTQNPEDHNMSGRAYCAVCEHELPSDFLNTKPLDVSFLPLLQYQLL